MLSDDSSKVNEPHVIGFRVAGVVDETQRGTDETIASDLFEGQAEQFQSLVNSSDGADA